MKKAIIFLGILMITIFLVGCSGKKLDNSGPTTPVEPTAEATPIDKEMASLDAELNVDTAGSDLANLDKDLDNL